MSSTGRARSAAVRGLFWEPADPLQRTRTAYWWPPDVAGGGGGTLAVVDAGVWLHLWVPESESAEALVGALEASVYYAWRSRGDRLVAREIARSVGTVQGKRARDDGTWPTYPALGSGGADGPSQWIGAWRAADAADALLPVASRPPASRPPPGFQRLAVQVRHQLALAAMVRRIAAPAAADGVRLYGRPCAVAFAWPSVPPPAATALGDADAMADSLWEAGVLAGVPAARALCGPAGGADDTTSDGTLELDGAAEAPVAVVGALRLDGAAWTLGPLPTVGAVLARAAVSQAKAAPAAPAMDDAAAAAREARLKQRKAQERNEALRARDHRKGQQLLSTMFCRGPAKPQ